MAKQIKVLFKLYDLHNKQGYYLHLLAPELLKEVWIFATQDNKHKSSPLVLNFKANNGNIEKESKDEEDSSSSESDEELCSQDEPSSSEDSELDL